MIYLAQFQIFLAFFSMVSFYGSCLNGKLSVLVIVLSFIVSSFGFYILRNNFVNKSTFTEFSKKDILILTILSPIIFFQFIFICFLSDQGWYIGDPFNFGDLTFHIGLINYFSRGGNYWPDNYIFANHVLKYPALVDHFSAVLNVVGVSIRSGFLIVGFLSTLLTYFLLHRLGGYFLVFGFFFGSGLYQWVDLLQGSLFKIYETIDFKSILMSIWIPQRGFQWGIPIGLILILKVKSFYETGELQKKDSLAMSVLWALLAMIHVHTFFVLSFFILTIFIFSKQYRLFLQTALVAFLLSSPYWWMIFTHNVDSVPMLHFDWFWTWNKTENILYYLIKNWSVLILLCFYFFNELRSLKGFHKVVLYFGLGLFFFAQFVILAPWNWDNIKILLWAYVLLLWVLSTVLSRKGLSWIFIVLFTPGLLIAIKFVGFRGTDVRWLSREDVVESNWLKTQVDVNKILLIAPEANHPALVAGQRVSLGYPGNVWSQGAKYDFIEADYKLIQSDPTKLSEILDKYKISGVYWGDRERKYFKIDTVGHRLGPEWQLRGAIKTTEVWIRNL